MSEAIEIHSPSEVRQILKSGQFTAYPMIEIYQQIQEKTGLDFNATLRLLRCLPLFLEGRQHQDVRKVMAVRLSAVQADQRKAVLIEIERIATALIPGREIDLIEEMALPLWRSTSQCLLPREGQLSNLIESITKLFYPTLSLRKRLQINAGIQKYIDGCEDDVHEHLIMLSMAALGARPFVGSFALSIFDIVDNNKGKTLSQIDWPSKLISSSLRFVDRTVAEPMTCHGRQFGSGDRVRCYTHTSVYSDHSNVDALFGYGAHVCLGRTISEYSWRMLVDRLEKLDVNFVPLERRLDTHTEPFTMPIVARVRID